MQQPVYRYRNHGRCPTRSGYRVRSIHERVYERQQRNRKQQWDKTKREDAQTENAKAQRHVGVLVLGKLAEIVGFPGSLFS